MSAVNWCNSGTLLSMYELPAGFRHWHLVCPIVVRYNNNVCIRTDDGFIYYFLALDALFVKAPWLGVHSGI